MCTIGTDVKRQTDWPRDRTSGRRPHYQQISN